MAFVKPLIAHRPQERLPKYIKNAMTMILGTDVTENEQELNRPNGNMENVTTRGFCVICSRNLDKKTMNKCDKCHLRMAFVKPLIAHRPQERLPKYIKNAMTMILGTDVTENEQELNRPNGNMENVTTRGFCVIYSRNLDKKTMNKCDKCPLDMVYNDDIDGDIYVEPPEPNVDTDEDSGDEDGGGLIDSLTSRQLRANVEVRLPNNERIGVTGTEERETPNTVPIASFATPIRDFSMAETSKNWIPEREKQKPEPMWTKGADFDIEMPTTFPLPDYSKYKNMSIIEIYEEFIDSEFIQHLVEETKRYAQFLNCADPKITTDEIRCFIAILYVSGYNLPSKRNYWDSNEDMRNDAVAKSMRRALCR
ncbi:transposase is4 [Holotrichia oblita]|uniref:Transposase is4 n=1 Tax=Holotrichia oblita TaxID=644536 RepID=A0ACB9T853_HOLOL|nr:transposase is4 [Holotrichia oblita]